MKLVFICSPLRASTPEGYAANIARVRRLCRAAMLHDTTTPVCAVAPHAYLPEFLDDTKFGERDLGLKAGKELLTRCDEVWVCTKYGISEGMQAEIELAIALGGKPVRFNPDAFDGVE